ncbi:hypothetical protein LGH82_13475 [Mesorhizobium sp. PAMC28654]|nr:hypothetical protein LGH82_13475 [Mesorhizobium sp. PAMC28654]
MGYTRQAICRNESIKGEMPSSLIRRGIWAIGAAVIVAVLVVAALPLIASTRIVRDRIAWEMSVERLQGHHRRLASHRGLADIPRHPH